MLVVCMFYPHFVATCKCSVHHRHVAAMLLRIGRPRSADLSATVSAARQSACPMDANQCSNHPTSTSSAIVMRCERAFRCLLAGCFLHAEGSSRWVNNQGSTMPNMQLVLPNFESRGQAPLQMKTRSSVCAANFRRARPDADLRMGNCCRVLV